MTNDIAQLLQQLRAKGAPLSAIEEIARRPGPNKSEIEKEAG
jgi:hypothetical protein